MILLLTEVLKNLALSFLLKKATQISHNETLKANLDNASQDKEGLKQMHNNYFLQVQNLINQKYIEAPGAKKK